MRACRVIRLTAVLETKQSYAIAMSDEQISPPTDSPEPEGYDAWVREQVEIAIRESEAPGAVFYTLEESNERMRRLRESLSKTPLEKAS